MTSRVLRGVAVLALLPMFGLVFWVAATVASGFPGLVAVAVNVHGLGLPSYTAESIQRPAPLSLQVLQDAYGDAGRAAISAPQVVGSHAPMPSPTPLPLPTPPIPLPTPTPTPAAAIIGGHVLDSQTLLPIVGATVSVSPGGKSALTDANGNFSISVYPGTYTVTASAATYDSANQTVTVLSGQKASISFRLVSIAAFGSLTGKVIDSAYRTPIAGATVWLSDGMIRTTDLNGNFTYAIVPNGTYTVTVSALGYVTQSKSVTIVPSQTAFVQIVLARTSQQLGGY